MGIFSKLMHLARRTKRPEHDSERFFNTDKNSQNIEFSSDSSIGSLLARSVYEGRDVSSATLFSIPIVATNGGILAHVSAQRSKDLIAEFRSDGLEEDGDQRLIAKIAR